MTAMNSLYGSIDNRGSGISTAIIVLTSSQIKNLHATPIQIIGPKGTGKVIFPVDSLCKLTYGGNNAFATGQTLSAVYTGTTASLMTMGTSAFITTAANQYFVSGMTTTAPSPTAAAAENAGISIYNASATEISGNAANDNTLTVCINYMVCTI